MNNPTLPPPVVRYFAAKEANDVDEVLSCFSNHATVWDNGEDRQLQGVDQIREWLEGTVSAYKLTTEVPFGQWQGEEYVAGAVVSGDFAGSPYEFSYRFRLAGDKIAELAIDPIGLLAA